MCMANKCTVKDGQSIELKPEACGKDPFDISKNGKILIDDVLTAHPTSGVLVSCNSGDFKATGGITDTFVTLSIGCPNSKPKPKPKPKDDFPLSVR